MKRKYISIFSGIEAVSCALDEKEWEPVAFSEIDTFPSAVLKKHYPDVPNLGDITKIDWRKYEGEIHTVCGGSPSQSFSLAGKREGLSGESGLMFEYIRCVREIRPKWFVWENVPGALSVEDGNAFGQLLKEMDELGYGMAWRILDSQFFGVAQRRRRLFLVGSLGTKRAAEVLFERESLRWDYPSSGEKRKSVAGKADSCVRESDSDDGSGFDAEHDDEMNAQPTCPITMMDTQSNAAVGYDCCNTLTAHAGKDAPIVMSGPNVRRLTPLECERIQGFPDGWTDILYNGKPASDSKRYKALGNSMAVPVMKWISERIVD